jgi:hypothetical protein
LANWLIRLGTRHFFRKIAKTRESLELNMLPALTTITAPPFAQQASGKEQYQIGSTKS